VNARTVDTDVSDEAVPSGFRDRDDAGRRVERGAEQRAPRSRSSRPQGGGAVRKDQDAGSLLQPRDERQEIDERGDDDICLPQLPGQGRFSRDPGGAMGETMCGMHTPECGVVDERLDPELSEMVLAEECGVRSVACCDLSRKLLARIWIDERYAH
jgi:hypothetical protein